MSSNISAPAFTVQQIPEAGIPMNKLESPIINRIAEMEVGIILASSAGTYDPDLVVPDLFNAVAGKESTVDTSKTDATFNSNLYEFDGTVLSTFFDTTNAAQVSEETGLRISFSSNGHLTKVIKDSDCTANTAYLRALDGTLLATTSFSGQTATFNYACTANTQYRLTVGAGGSNYQRSYKVGGLPATVGLCTAHAGCTNNADDGTPANPLSIWKIGYDVGEASVVSQALAVLDGAVTHLGVFAYKLNLASGAAVVVDVDYDGDGTYEYTGLPINYLNAIPQTLSNAVVRVRFQKGTSTTASNISGWGIMAVE